MAVGKGSIKRASNAAKAKTTAVQPEVKTETTDNAEVNETKTETAKTAPKKTAAKTTKKTAAKTTATKRTPRKTTAAKETAKTENKEKTYELVDGISCNMPKFLL